MRNLNIEKSKSREFENFSLGSESGILAVGMSDCAILVYALLLT
jgi:hypothetical protein